MEVKRYICEGPEHEEREATDADDVADVRVSYTDYAALKARVAELEGSLEKALDEWNTERDTLRAQLEAAKAGCICTQADWFEPNRDCPQHKHLKPQLTAQPDGVRAALEEQVRGAFWRRENEPQNWNGADDEALERAMTALGLDNDGQALQALSAAPAREDGVREAWADAIEEAWAEMSNQSWSDIDRGHFGDKKLVIQRLENKAIAKQALAAPAPAPKEAQLRAELLRVRDLMTAQEDLDSIDAVLGEAPAPACKTCGHPENAHGLRGCNVPLGDEMKFCPCARYSPDCAKGEL